MIIDPHCSARLEHDCLLSSSKQLPVKSSLHMDDMPSDNGIACDAEINAQHICKLRMRKGRAFHVKL